MPRGSINPKRNRKKALDEAERRIAEAFRKNQSELDLTRLGLANLPESLRKLTWLDALYLDHNDLTGLPGWIGELAALRRLTVHQNPLRSVPSSLSRLVGLEVLILNGGSKSVANEVIGRLINLRELAIGNLDLTEVPAWVRNLHKLTDLHLSGSRLTELPEWLGELSALERLGVSDSYLHALPVSLRDLDSLEMLWVDGNPALRLPSEIVGRGDAQKILDYYFRTAAPGAAQPLNEFKLILVGRGGVGKTTLVHRLVTDKYKEFKRTPGIKITQWPSKIDDDEVRAHIWDFGGQEIMHGTHRFFMTERALYLVLISGREGTEDRDAEYWLSLIRSFAGNVPVIVLLHKWDDYSFELNRSLLRDKYGKGLVFLETDSSSGQGIPDLRDRVCRLAKKLPGLKAAWPTQWRRIKEVLPSKKKSWLTFDDFRRFCGENGVTDPSAQEALAESLHDLGLTLSYRKEETLRDFGVLNPQWVTKGIYDILNSRKLKEAAGKFTLKTLAEVLPAGNIPRNFTPTFSP